MQGQWEEKEDEAWMRQCPPQSKTQNKGYQALFTEDWYTREREVFERDVKWFFSVRREQ